MNLPALLAGLSIEPTVVAGLLIAALLYWWGARYSAQHGMARHHRWWQSLAFYLGLLVVFVALNGPLDVMAGQFFWAHMLQHELLILGAAPLLLLGAPLMPLWRAVPLGARRGSLGWAMTQRWPRRLAETLAHWLGGPRVAWVLFTAVFIVWHLPALYDLALRVEPVHVLEHMMFLGVALLFWAQVVPSVPLRRRMGYLAQAIYVGSSAMVMNGLSAVYMYSTAPMYPYYAALPRPAGVISALVDQHIAGAVMDVPGTVLIFVAISALILLWLRDDERHEDTGVRPSGGRWTTLPPSGAPAIPAPDAPGITPPVVPMAHASVSRPLEAGAGRAR